MTLLAQFAATGGGVPAYIEDVFSTYLYTGNGSTQTITNGINLSTKGGLVWIKGRNVASEPHTLFDTARGVNQVMQTNNTDASANFNNSLTAFNTTGFSLGTNRTDPSVNFASWTFREQPKFFDVVTYTGTGADRTVAHALGSVPGCIIVKRTDTTGAWQAYHRSLANTEYLVLNSTAAVATGATRWNSTTPTSTEFSLGTDATVNASAGTYVAYLFAHDAGGFGLTGSDNVISCGTFTTDGSENSSTTLGYEPQWLLIKKTSATQDWYLADDMRGLNVVGLDDAFLYPNLNSVEALNNRIGINSTGFTTSAFGASSTFIYIAIRRGPMAVPTTGTSVFGLNARTGTGANATVTGSAGVSDAVLVKNRGSAIASLFSSRLTSTGYLVTSDLNAEVAAGTTILQASPWDVMDGVKVGTTSTITNSSGNTFINYLFKRAPSFFDVVCFTGDGAGVRAINHNLGVTPTFMILKQRSVSGYWAAYHSLLTYTGYLFPNSASAAGTDSNFWGAAPTSSTFSVGSYRNGVSETCVNYLFATCPGVSKVGSYTGTGTTQIINCGFTAGSRFILIKRTDASGDWYFWDSARGIIAGNDPYLLFNNAAAEVTGTDYVDTAATGFELSSTAPAAINANGGTYIFLAIA